MTTKEMKYTYTQLIKKERSLNKQVNKYNTLINSLLVEIRGLGEKLDASSTKDTLLLLQKEKSKLESKLISVKLDKNILSAKIKNIFARIRESGTIQELFTSLNDKYESYSIPVEFTYEYDSELDEVKNVTFYKVNPNEK
jgi:hypothetical protein